MAELFLVKNERAQQAPDATQRETALDTRRSFIVEAPAGSGKTGLLIQRLLKLLADPEVTEPEQVLAITFTVKATAELRERVLTQLDNAAANTPTTNPFDAHTRTLAAAVLARDRALNWGLRERPQRLRIRTIDSVCAEIARSLPVLSGSGGQLAPVLDAAPLHREAARRTFQLLGGPDPALNAALRDILLHRNGNLADCEHLLAEMLQWRDQWGELIPLSGAALSDEALDATVLPRLERALEQAICTGLTQLAKTIPADALDELSHLAAELGRAPGYNGTESPIALCAGLRTAPGETAEHLAHWRALIHLLTTAENKWRKEKGITGRNLKFEYDRKHPHHASLASILDQLGHRDDLLTTFDRIKTLPPAKYPPEQWAVARSLFRILRRALVEVQFVFAERGECDFTELSLLARTALGRDTDGEDLAAALGMRLQHLLVDEMQDTSTSQYELIERLTRGWDGASQTVFLVGDPKQSIYLFRQARVARFVRTMRAGLLGDLPVASLYLTANFRSQRTLVEQVNADFSVLFPTEVTPNTPEDVPFAAAAPTRAATTAEGRRWHTHILAAKADGPQQRRDDALAIRRLIQQARDRNPACTIAVLVRSRSHLTEIVAGLKQADDPIPFRAVDIDPLADRQEVLDLLALTRALLHPADRVAWLAILRAPWCGLTLADLHQLAGADDPAFAQTTITDLFRERGELLTPDGCQRLERLWLVMDAAQRQRGRLTTAQWVERTWRSLGGNLWLDPEATANALHYLQLLDEIEMETATGTIDTVLLESRLKRLNAEPAVHPGAIDLMTIHGSKGLEWDVVIVPALERRGQSTRSRLLNWVELDIADPLGEQAAAPIVLAPIVGRGEDSSELNAWLRSIENAREAAERKRLVYVACTRAREELHLFAAPAARNDGTASIPADSLLRAAWPAAEPHFAAAASPAPSNVMEIDEPPVSFDLAATAETPEPPPLLHRLSSNLNLAARFAAYTPLVHTAEEASSPTRPFERPEGGFAARAFGNAVHVFLEQIAQRIASGATPAALTTELPQWTPRIAAILRADGLPPAMADRLTQRVQIALQNTLVDSIGQWLLKAHPDAASERALTAWQQHRTSIRLDRIFRAGPSPLAEGSDHLWIVDFKTTTHSPTGLEAFLQKERETYTPQMTTYAEILTAAYPATPIRTMLYYPMLPTNIWWSPEPLSPIEAQT